MSHWDFGHPADRREPPPPLPFANGTLAGTWAEDGTWSDDAAPSSGAGEPSSADGGWPATGDVQENDEQWTDEYWDGPEGWSTDDGWVGAEGTGPYPITYERPEVETPGGGTADPFADEYGAEEPTRVWDHQPAPDWASVEDWRLPPDGRSPGARDGHSGRGTRRWLLPAGIAVVAAGIGVGTVLLTSGHPAAQGGQQQAGGGFAAPSVTASAPGRTAPSASPSASPSPSASASASPSPSASAAGGAGPSPLTMAQAQGVMAAYTEANNSANAQRNNTMLATVETGSSYAIDAGLYQMQRGIGAAPFPAFGPVRTAYYIPRSEPAGGPRWFVVQVANAFFASPHKVSATEYLLFTQATTGGPWLNAVEPYLISGAGAPQVALGADGLATAVDPAATTFTAVPSQLPQLTAASLDGTGTGIADPGNLSDRGDERYWRGKLPNATVTDTHSVTAGAEGQVHALQTADGGALVFYTDAAQLTITPPAGTALHLTVPGFYSPAQALSRAGVSYLEQFAVYDAPTGAATASPRVVAAYSGITGKN